MTIMRTRSSRSYALEPVLPPAARDVYEIAGEGLLESIEESFYLDDDDDVEEVEGDNGEEEEQGHLEELSDLDRNEEEEEEIVVFQCPPKRRLLVKLRIPTRAKATSTLDAGSQRLSSDTKVTSLAHKERPRLMITPRMTRSAGQVKHLLVMADTHQNDTPNAAATKVEEEPASDLHKELAEVKHRAETSSNGGDSKERHNKIALLDEWLPVQNTVQEDRKLKEQREADMKLDSKMEDPVSSESITVLSVGCGEDISFVKRVDGEEELVAAIESEEDKDMGLDLKDEAHVERQPEEESHDPSEHGDSRTAESSTSSSHFNDGVWPTNKISEDLTTSLVPTPLTMPSPELPLQQLNTPPREQSPRIQSKKRRRSSGEETSGSEIHGQKRQKLRVEGNETEISIPGLREATRGTGVVEAGLVAQQRRGVLPRPTHSARSQTDTPRQHQQQARRPVQKPKRKPLEKSGRQRLLEQRISASSSQRPRGGRKAARTVMRPAKRKRK